MKYYFPFCILSFYLRNFSFLCFMLNDINHEYLDNLLNLYSKCVEDKKIKKEMEYENCIQRFQDSASCVIDILPDCNLVWKVEMKGHKYKYNDFLSNMICFTYESIDCTRSLYVNGFYLAHSSLGYYVYPVYCFRQALKL